ncbi:MAG: TetR/AcrR family transcriptional regulator [Alphaproteobacteria bacterium]|nr:TetR/AcrR family transcriptional regulator [Alphaproteobacteria bacterium]
MGRPKGDKRARTRARLLAAARELVREKGYQTTTLEDIAQRAGMTTGAIYSNFRNRQALFTALSETYWAPIKPRIPEGASLAQILEAFAQATIEAIPARREAAEGFLTGRAFALNDPETLAQAREVTATHYEEGARWLRGLVDEPDLLIPLEQLPPILHALSDGLVLQRLLTPALIPDAVIHSAFAALAARARGDGRDPEDADSTAQGMDPRP